MAEGSSLLSGWRRWIIVPALAWGGILAGFIVPFRPPFLSFGALGCVLASAAIAAMAYLRPKKDIVSLCVPIFAVFIFIFPLETKPGPFMEVIYAVTLTALVIRLETRFPA